MTSPIILADHRSDRPSWSRRHEAPRHGWSHRRSHDRWDDLPRFDRPGGGRALLLLPRSCETRLLGAQGGGRTVLPAPCLRAAGVSVRHLPLHCGARARGPRGVTTVFGLRCLQAEGYQTAQRWSLRH